MALKKLSINLFNSILDFMSLNDFLSLSFVCRKFYKHIQSDTRLFLKEHLKNFSLQDMSDFYEYYEDLSFQAKFLARTPERIFKMTQNPFWKQALMEKSYLSGQWLKLFTMNSGQNKQSFLDFIAKFDFALQNPGIPFFLMIRENYGRNCKTTFQRKILESALYNNTRMSSFDDEDSIFEFLNENPLSMKNESFDLLQARWYSFTKDSKLMDFQLSPLLQVYNLLIRTIENFVFSIREYLKSLDDPFYLLQEYCAYWARFCHSIFEMEALFSNFTKMMNEIYEKEFLDLPTFPKFSMMRLMIKIWLRSVHDQIKDILLEAFAKAFQELREIKRLPYQNVFEKNIEKKEEYHDNFYKNNSFALESLIHNFVEALTDMSVSELTIHYLGHSKIRFSSLFIEFEEKFKTISQNYYQSLSINCKEDLIKLDEFVNEDINMLKSVINEKMISSLKLIKYQALTTILKKNTLNQIYKCRKNSHERPKKIIKNEKITLMMGMMEDIFAIKSNGNQAIYSSPFLSHLYKNLKKCCGKNFLTIYRQNKLKMENHLNKKKKKDEEIEKFLEWKNIGNVPADIIDFFDFSKNTSFKSLNGFRKKFEQKSKDGSYFK